MPEAGVDDIVFDPALSQGSCDYGLPPPGGHPPGPIAEMGRSITMMAGYTGTVTIYTAIDLERFEQHGGSFEQYAEDAHIWTDEWIWSAGDLNANSPFLADINVKPGGSATVTGDDRTQGANAKIGANSYLQFNLNHGKKITFTKNAGIDIAAGALFEHTRGDFSAPAGHTGRITNAGKYYKLTEEVIFSSLPFHNNATTSEFHLGGYLGISDAGQVSGVSFLQENGFIALAPGAHLQVSRGLTISAGKLLTAGTSGSRITGNVIVHGGQIVLSHDDLSRVGWLNINGHFLMDGGEYEAKVDGRGFGADLIQARSVTLGGGTAKLTAETINLPPDTEVATMTDWLILEATEGTVNGEFDIRELDRGDGSSKDFWVWVYNDKKYSLSTKPPDA